MHRMPTVATLTCLLALAAGSRAGANTAWPGLRGPTYDGAVREATFLPADGGGLTIGWKRPLGPGYSVVAVDGERLVAAFQAGDEDVVAAFDLDSGDELWRAPIGAAYRGHSGSHDGPVGSPALVDGRVFGLGPRGHLFALDAGSGEALWTKHLVDDLGAESPYYGFASSPVVADGVLVVGIGAGEGKAIAGFDPAGGEQLWSVGDDKIKYQSPIVASIGGRPQVVAAGGKHLMGIDPASGQALWTYEHQGDESEMGGATIIPVPAGEGRLLLLHQQPSSSMVQVRATDDGYEASELWSGNSIRGTYVQPVYHDGYLYGMTGKIFTCVDAETGETVWRSREPGDGFPTLVGGQLVILNKPGTLHVADATPEGYRELARLDLFEEHSWSAVAYAGGHLWARSMGHLARVDLAQAAPAGVEAEAMAASGFAAFLSEVDRAEDKQAVVDAYLGEQGSFPIVEGSGEVHFVYRGEAGDVGIVGDMIGFRREDPMTPVAGTDLFYYSTRLEPDAAVAYGFIPDYGDPVPDPLNSQAGEGLFGEVSWFAMPAWRAPDFLGEPEADRQGRLEPIEWTSEVREGATRQAQVYLPAGYDSEPERRYAVAYFFDGTGSLEKGDLKAALDNLSGRTIEPILAVFVTPDPENRGDLRAMEPYSDMVAQELVPLIDERYRTVAQPLARAAVGAASAGDLAFFSGLRHPTVFGRVGSLWPVLFGDGMPAIPQAAAQPLVIYHSWGTYHLRSPHEAWDQADENREFWAALRAAGHRPAGGEVPEGYGWANWRARTDDLLSALFPLR